MVWLWDGGWEGQTLAAISARSLKYKARPLWSLNFSLSRLHLLLHSSFFNK